MIECKAEAVGTGDAKKMMVDMKLDGEFLSVLDEMSAIVASFVISAFERAEVSPMVPAGEKGVKVARSVTEAICGVMSKKASKRVLAMWAEQQGIEVNPDEVCGAQPDSSQMN